MPPPQISKDEVIARLTATFRRWGYDGATLSRLSEATGLVKASLYHYFPKGKQDMARAVLMNVHDRFYAEVVTPLLDDQPNRQALEAFAANLVTFYMEGNASCLFEVFTLGSAQELFGESIGQNMIALQEALAGFLSGLGHSPEEAPVIARRGLMIIQGALVVHRGVQDGETFKQAMEDLPNILMPSDN